VKHCAGEAEDFHPIKHPGPVAAIILLTKGSASLLFGNDLSPEEEISNGRK